jgi:hypothetical protein
VELAEVLLGLARENRGFPSVSAEWAELGLRSLATSAERPERAEVAALCWAEIGNAWRIASKWSPAKSAFGEAQRELRGVADPLVHVEVASLEASLLDARRQLPLAVQVLRAALDVAESLAADTLVVARLRVQLGTVLGHAEELESAVQELVLAFEQIDGRRAPQLALTCVHNLAEFAVDLGRTDLPIGLLMSWEPAYAQSEALQVRRRWLLARIGIRTDFTIVSAEMLSQVERHYELLGAHRELALLAETALELHASKGDRPRLVTAAARLAKLAAQLDLPADLLAAVAIINELAQTAAPLEVLPAAGRLRRGLLALPEP